MIALLCPSKGRPEKLQRMIQSAFDTTSQKILIYVAVNPEEFETYQSKLVLPESDRVGLCLVTMPDLMPTAHKWNRLAELAMKEPNQLFMIAGDDMIFDSPGWDIALTFNYNALGNKIHVYHLQDSRDENGTPHPIVTREYIKAMYYLVPPWFTHWHIDTWTVDIAKSQNCFTHLKGYSLIHDKDSDKGEPDQTHLGIRSYGWRERDDYVNKIMRSCGLYAAEEMRFYTHVRKPDVIARTA